MKSVCFEIETQQQGGKRGKRGKQVRLSPPATAPTNLDLLLIAARCVQIVGDKQGLDRATEMLNKILYKGQRLRKPSSPDV